MTERPTNTQPDKHHKVAHVPQKQTPIAHSQDKKEEKPAVTSEVKSSKKEEKQISKKSEAISHGLGLRASLKHSMYIGRFIKYKSIDQSLQDLQEVIGLRKVVPFKGEIPHRSAPGVMSGRYPRVASQEFIRVLKNLKGNAIANGLELDKVRIYHVSPSWAFRPMRRGGRKAKRVNVTVKAKEMKQEEKNNG